MSNSAIPLVGSTANACTDVNTPERTINVSKILKQNVMKARLRDHFKSCCFPLATPKLCNKAVEVSQGNKLAFSTGSQHHQPPQPNS